MDLLDYQEKAAKTAIYPRDTPTAAIVYTSLGLSGEAGEIANKVKKILRDDCGHLTSARRQQLRDELGDVLWYAAMLAFELGYTLNEVANANLDKLQLRAMRQRLQGEGDDRQTDHLPEGSH